MSYGVLGRIVVILIFSGKVFAAPDLERFKKESPAWQALELQEKALAREIYARDLVNSAELTATAATIRNERQILAPPSSVRYDSRLLNAEVSKYFATGTTLSASTGIDTFSFRNDPDTQNNLGNFDVTLTQNLWKDFFGSSERIRRRLNDKELQMRRAELSLDKAQLLIRFEDLYWSYANLISEVRLREESLERWASLDRWIRNRFSRSAAEVVDVKQIAATRTLREIQVQSLRQTLLNQKNAIDSLVGPGFANTLAIRESALDENTKNKILNLNSAVSLESIIYSFRSDLSAERVQKNIEDNRPDLKLILQVGRSGVGESSPEAWRDAYADKGNYTSVGISFSTPLELNLKKASTDSAELRFQADDVLKRNAEKNSQISWSTLQSQISEVQARLELLGQLVKDQAERRTAEQRRNQNGRSNSLQLVTAEQDALDAQITLKATVAELNRLFARYHLFDLSNKDMK